MKEVENLASDKTELHAPKPIHKATQFIGSLNPHRGQYVWEMNLDTRVIEMAQFKEASFDVEANTVRKKLIVKENCLYAVAINAKNADKKFFKRLGLLYPKNTKPKLKK